MRSKTGKRSAMVLAVAGTLALCAAAADAATLTIGDRTGEPGTPVSVPVSLEGGGATVAGTVNVIADLGAPVASKTVIDTLTANIGDADTTITVDDTSDFPDLGTVTIEGETIDYYGLDFDDPRIMIVGACKDSPPGSKLACKTAADCGSGTCIALGRGTAGTTAAGHNAGATVAGIGALPSCTTNPALRSQNVVAVFTYTNVACFTAAPPAPPAAKPTCECGGDTGKVCDGVAAAVLKLKDIDTSIPDGPLYSCTYTVPETTTPIGCPVCDPATPGAASACPAAGGSDGSALATTCRDGSVGPEAAGCFADCDGSGEVEGNDITIAVRAAVGLDPDISRCPRMDLDGSLSIEGNEITRAVRIAIGLDTCP